MNKIRRRELSEIAAALGTYTSKLLGILDDERCYVDNIPENMQAGYKYEAGEEAVGKLEEAVGQLEEVMNLIYGAM